MIILGPVGHINSSACQHCGLCRQQDWIFYKPWNIIIFMAVLLTSPLYSQGQDGKLGFDINNKNV